MGRSKGKFLGPILRYNVFFKKVRSGRHWKNYLEDIKLRTQLGRHDERVVEGRSKCLSKVVHSEMTHLVPYSKLFIKFTANSKQSFLYVNIQSTK